MLTAVEDTPERATARAIAPFVKTSLGDVPVEAVAGDANGLEPNGTRGLPRAAFVRVGELHYNTVRDLKQRVSADIVCCSNSIPIQTSTHVLCSFMAMAISPSITHTHTHTHTDLW